MTEIFDRKTLEIIDYKKIEIIGGDMVVHCGNVVYYPDEIITSDEMLEELVKKGDVYIDYRHDGRYRVNPKYYYFIGIDVDKYEWGFSDEFTGETLPLAIRNAYEKLYR